MALRVPFTPPGGKRSLEQLRWRPPTDPKEAAIRFLWDGVERLMSKDTVMAYFANGLEFRLLNAEAAERLGIPVMAIDKKGRVYVNEAAISPLTHLDYPFKLRDPEELAAVIAHEIMHKMLAHTVKEVEHPRLYNIAADAIINAILEDVGYQLPRFVLTKENFLSLFPEFPPDYHKIYTVDELYSMLYQKMATMMEKLEKLIREYREKYSAWKGEEVEREEEESGEERERELEKNSTPVRGSAPEGGFDEVKEGAGRFVDFAFGSEEGGKGAGKGTSPIARFISQIRKRKPMEEWNKLLWNLAISVGFGRPVPGETYRRADRAKQVPPREIEEYYDTPAIIALVDVSGSIGEEELEEFISELVAVADYGKRMGQDVKMFYIPWHDVAEEPVELPTHAGAKAIAKKFLERGASQATGGTNVIPALEAAAQLIKKKGLQYVLTAVLTDGVWSELDENVDATIKALRLNVPGTRALAVFYTVRKPTLKNANVSKFKLRGRR